jgi:16S rRNA G966 N2-methylase RsmD
MTTKTHNPADKVERWSIDKLTPYARNSRTHSDEQISQLAASIKEWGWTTPVLVDEDGSIIAGHGRTLAAQRLKMTEVPVMVAKGWSDAKKRAYVIADNKLAMNAGWDEQMLALEFSELQGMDFDLDLTGFTADEIAALMPEEIERGQTDEDAVPEVPEQPVTVLGDVWVLGKHRLMCGDSTSIDAVDKLMDGATVDMVYTDPPYGISIVKGSKVGGDKPFGSKDTRGTVGATNIVKANLYAPIAGDDTIDVALEAIQVIKTLSAKVEIIWGGNYYANALENSSCWIVWDKENTGNFADAELAWTNQKTAVRIFKHMWNGMVKASEHGQKRVHPTQKPVKLAEWCIQEYGDKCQNLLDLFCGSGSTLLACETKKKTGYMMELSPHYCDVIVKRWQDFTGKIATHAETGKPFAEVTNDNKN